MNLVIDIGNTRVKAAVFDADRIVGKHAGESSDRSVVEELLLRHPAVGRAIVASTGGAASPWVEALRARAIECLEFTPRTPVPIGNAYATPQTLGADRLAAAVGAAAAARGRASLIFDFGTALTVDFVSAEGVFRGGTISPGMRLRFEALHEHTARLPLCAGCDEVRLYGDSTRTAIEQGVMNGMTYEIEGHIARFREQEGEMCVFFTGGDANFFVKRIKNAIFANCDLVFCGLNRILEYNVAGKK